MLKGITEELKDHVPFTAFGAVTGIILIFLFYRLPRGVSYNIFYTLHPAHVLLSSFVTASMYSIHRYGGKRSASSFWKLILIGYFGSVGIATLSDSLIPYIGETLLRMPERHVHLGFIEECLIVNPLALLGAAVAYFKPFTKIPHAGHVLLSTWASLFHIIMALGGALGWGLYLPIFIFLFIAVWLPCCVSDIVFPLLFVKDKREPNH